VSQRHAQPHNLFVWSLVMSQPASPRPSPPAASPFHAGEIALQERAGVRARLAETGRRVIRDFMPEQHRDFFRHLPFLIVGSLDRAGRPWASMLTGLPGFVASPDPHTLRIAARPGPHDPLAKNLAAGAPLGLLGIELATRRRNRMNGRVSMLDGSGFAVGVDQSFGNCPQYIQARDHSFVAEGAAEAQATPQGARLDAHAAALVHTADTFFIATASPDVGSDHMSEGVDVSHRGGKPGFVRVDEEDGATVLTAPDFRGNFYFNTLGNIASNPRAGLLFVDFASGDLLLLTGAAEIVWDGPEVKTFAGAQRLLRCRIEEGVLIAGAIPLRFTPPEQAPQLGATGSWSEVTAAP
jgi:predicted pyridoxine 5'-phosphate oxidase superfamily flavin-nucleotide-binding protein